LYKRTFYLQRLISETGQSELYLDLLYKNMFFNRICRAAATDNPMSLTFPIRLGNVNKVEPMLNGRYTAFRDDITVA